MTAMLIQEHAPIDLVVFQDAPWDLSFTVEGRDWSGTHTCTVRAALADDADLLASPTVAATLVDTDTEFTISLSGELAAALPVGIHYYDIRAADDTLRAVGRVHVKRTV